MSLLIDALKRAETRPLGSSAATGTGSAAWISAPGNIASSLGLSRPMGLVALAAIVFISAYFVYVYFAMKGPGGNLFARLQPAATTTPATPSPAQPAVTAELATPALTSPALTTPEPATVAATAAPPARPPETASARATADMPPEANGNRIEVMPESRQSYSNPQVLQAYQAWQQGRLNEATALYQTALQQQPANMDALLGLAAIASQRSQPDQAVRYYSKALQLDPHNPTAQAGLINLADAADPATAGIRLKQLSASHPDNAALHYALGNHYSRQNNWQAAETAYFSAFERDSRNPDYAFNLAVSLEHMEQPKQALTYYERALQLANERGSASFDPGQAANRIRLLTSTP